jgi:hypothetical protein
VKIKYKNLSEITLTPDEVKAAVEMYVLKGYPTLTGRIDVYLQCEGEHFSEAFVTVREDLKDV